MNTNESVITPGASHIVERIHQIINLNNIDDEFALNQCLELEFEHIEPMMKNMLESALQRSSWMLLRSSYVLEVDVLKFKRLLVIVANNYNRSLVYNTVKNWLKYDDRRLVHTVAIMDVVRQSMSSVRFDPLLSDDSAIFSCRNTKVLVNSERNCFVIGMGCCSFYIRLLRGCKNLMVGMVSRLSLKKRKQRICGWYLSCGNGNLYSHIQDKPINYLRQQCYTDGTVIGVLMENGVLRFSLNGVNRGVAFGGLSDDVVPAFHVRNSGCEFELL